MVLKIKICGITNFADAQAAVAAGADALGFMLYERSPRFLSVEAAAEIIRRLPPLVAKVGVFVNASEGTVIEARNACGFDTFQFHGDEPPDFCRRFAPMKAIKAFRIRDENSLLALPDYQTDAWLLDSYVPGQEGGTGTRFNWPLAVAAKQHGVPIILAGGLTPENVATAIRQVRPFGVDVSSGVESVPGKKDHDKLRAFIAAARAAALEVGDH